MSPSSKRPCLTACLALTLIAVMDAIASTAPPPEDVLTVPQGQSLLLEYEGVTRVAVGDGQLLEVKIIRENDEILLIARKAGVTDLRLWRPGDQPRRYLVQVHGDTEYVSVDEIQKLLTGIAGVEVNTSGKSIVLQGRAERESDLGRIQAITQRYPTVYSYVEPPVFERNPTILLQARLLEVRRSALKELGISWDRFIDGPVFGFLTDLKTNPC